MILVNETILANFLPSYTVAFDKPFLTFDGGLHKEKYVKRKKKNVCVKEKLVNVCVEKDEVNWLKESEN